MKREIVVFDFDETLTTKDTLAEFIKFAKGSMVYYWGLIVCSPILVAYMLKLLPNYKAKEYLFAHFFQGIVYEDFKQLGIDFANRVDVIARQKTLSALKEHKKKGHKLYVISASIQEWVKPWCVQQGVDIVMGTQVEIKDRRLTGRFLTKNCYGKEKVNRLLQAEPNRSSYKLYAYGDSQGDKEILAFADEAIWVK